MENLNKKRINGKTPKQIQDSNKIAWIGVVGMVIILILSSLFGCSHRTHVITEDGVNWYTTNKQ
jgi:hypothetical protein